MFIIKLKVFYFFFPINALKRGIRTQKAVKCSMKFTNKAMITTRIPVKTNEF